MDILTIIRYLIFSPKWFMKHSHYKNSVMNLWSCQKTILTKDKWNDPSEIIWPQYVEAAVACLSGEACGKNRSENCFIKRPKKQQTQEARFEKVISILWFLTFKTFFDLHSQSLKLKRKLNRTRIAFQNNCF